MALFTLLKPDGGESMFKPCTDLCGELSGKLIGEEFFPEDFYEEYFQEEIRLFGNDPLGSKYRPINDFSCEEGPYYQSPQEAEERLLWKPLLESHPIPLPSSSKNKFQDSIPCKSVNLNEIYFPVKNPEVDESNYEFEFTELENLPSLFSSRKSAMMLTGQNFGSHKVQKAHPVVREEDPKKNYLAVVSGKTASKKPHTKKNKRQSIKTMGANLDAPEYSISAYLRDNMEY